MFSLYNQIMMLS